ncbi:ABC transporter ATP-binding protein [Sphaerimonospora thailandensis]|uniref:ABC transporter ATP-binding protein n=1 Tax=Sphaerimonospora thailandensis TaxID=795644 RepID=A0A8J3R9N0_9ACTN|nr:ABC transporter ATP-binding protein [Sphaerimonospora thailandensis]
MTAERSVRKAGPARVDTPQNPVVLLADVDVTYGTGSAAVVALRKVNISFTAAEFTAVMGPSGSGKSTLLKCAAGLMSPTSGSVRLGDLELTAMPEAELAVVRRRKIGFVFQAFNLLPALTAEENITLPSLLDKREIDREWLAELIRKFGLEERTGHRPHELSGGQQQRVAVCRALLGRPDVIFADEPTGALDSHAGQQVLDGLRTAVDTMGQSVVMVTHNPVAAAHADRVVFLADGTVVDKLEKPTSDAVASRMNRLERRA